MQRYNLSYYDQWASQWWKIDATVAPLNRLYPLRFQFFDRYVSNWEGLKVLDVGCGGGFTCEFLAARGAQVTGIDQSASCIAAAKQHAADVNFSIDYYQGHSENLPFDPATCEIVVCVDVLEHVSYVFQSISEISRVVKPNSLVFFDTINRTWRSKLVMIWLLENTLRQIPYGVHDWRKFITPTELSELLSQNQIQPTAITGFDLFGKGLIGKWKSLWRYWQSGQFEVNFAAQADQIMYIGVGTKTVEIKQSK